MPNPRVVNGFLTDRSSSASTGLAITCKEQFFGGPLDVFLQGTTARIDIGYPTSTNTTGPVYYNGGYSGGSFYQAGWGAASPVCHGGYYSSNCGQFCEVQ